MDMKEIMAQRSFAVVGDTLNPAKYAFRIKNSMLDAGYRVFAVGSENKSLNDIAEDIDIIDLCINPVRGLAILKENRKSFRAVVIQPGAESQELLSWLEAQKIPYIQGCLLVGLSLYKNI